MMNTGRFAMKAEETPRQVILAFRGGFHFLSNFFPCRVTLDAADGIPAMDFPTVEHGYMAWKTTDAGMRRHIQDMTPEQAKDVTHTAGFPLRADYNDQGRIDIMRTLLRQKFGAQNPSLRDRLKATGDAVLIEGNTWGDVFFGFSFADGHGANHLGRLLMDIRQEIP